MSEDRLSDFLIDDEPVTTDAAETPAPSEQPQEPAQPPEQPQEPEQAPAQPEQPQAAPDAQPQATQPPPGFVPLAAVLDARDRAKALEQELQRLQGQLQPPEEPDPYEDPEGYRRHQAVQTEQLVLSTKLDISEDLARDRHGDELVDQAKAWALQRFRQSPAFQQEVLAQRNPYGYAVQQYQREQLLGQVSDPAEFEAFRAWKAAQTAAAQPPGSPAPAAPAAAPPQAAPPSIPRSLASAPSAGALAETVVDEDAGTVFAKKG